MSFIKGITRRLPHRVLCVFMMVALVALTAVPAFAGEPVQVDVTASVTGTNADMVNRILEDSHITVKADAAADSLLLNLDAAISGQNALKALVEIAGWKMAFSFPDIENVRYEYDLQKLPALYEYLFGPVPFGLQGNPDGAFTGIKTDITEDEVLSALSPYIEYLGEAVSSGMRSEEGMIVLEQLGKSTEGTITAYEPDAEDLSRICSDLADMIEADETLPALVDKICASITDPEGIGRLLNLSFTSAAGVDITEITSELQAGYTELPALLREAAGYLSTEGMGDAYIRLIIGDAGYFPCKYLLQAGSPSAGQAYEAGVEIDPDGAGFSIFADMPDQDISFTFDSVNTEGFSTTMVATVKVNKVPVFILTVTMDPEDGFSEEFPVKSASLDIVGVNIGLSVQDEESGKACILRVSGLEVPGDTVGISGVTVKAQTSPAGSLERPDGEVKDLSGYEPEALLEELQKLGEKIVNSIPVMTLSSGIMENAPSEEPAPVKGGNVSIEFVLGYGTEDAQTILTQEDIDYARSFLQSDASGNNGYCIEVGFNEAGTRAFADATRDHIGETLSILVDGEEISAPAIREEITDGKAVISGDFTEEDAGNIVDSLMK